MTIAATFNWPIALSLLSVVSVPLVTWLVARRTSSGNVNTSQAADLWLEGDKLRAFYLEEANGLRAERKLWTADTDRLRKEVGELHDQSNTCQSHIKKLRTKVRKLETEIRQLEQKLNR